MNDDFLNHDEKLQLAERIAYLIAGHLNGTLTDEESDELDDWITESDENLALFERLTDEDNIDAAMQQYQLREKEKAEALAGIKAVIGAKSDKGTVKRLWPLLIAASVIIVAGVFFLLRPKNQTKPTEKPIARQGGRSDRQAGSDKAVLTLSDGRTIILDSTGKGVVASEGGVSISTGADGGVVYNGTETAMKYNTVTTPRGGRFKLVLDDGTKVWLNAESSLRFPASFSGTGRNVELRGEGYFEVAKNAASPFAVTILTSSGEGGTVEVTGTHFNVNAYNDDGVVKATLLEGAIKLTRQGKSKLLAPGEQALITDEIKIVKANVTEETAWKDGRFLFRNAGIRTIGEQIKRWYDVEVEYRGEVTQHFNTEVSRNVPLSELLGGLEGTTQVHFELTGKNLIIKPWPASR